MSSAPTSVITPRRLTGAQFIHPHEVAANVASTRLVPQVPRFVDDVISIPGGGTVIGDVGRLPTVNAVAGVR